MPNSCLYVYTNFYVAITFYFVSIQMNLLTFLISILILSIFVLPYILLCVCNEYKHHKIALNSFSNL